MQIYVFKFSMSKSKNFNKFNFIFQKNLALQYNLILKLILLKLEFFGAIN